MNSNIIGSTFSLENMFSKSELNGSALGVDAFSQTQITPTQGKAEEFQSLLDLVAQLEVADSQSVGFDETFQNELGEFPDAGMREVKALVNQAEIMNAIPNVPLSLVEQAGQGSTVGQQGLLKQEVLAETVKQNNDLSVSAMELAAISGIKLNANKVGDFSQKGESVQKWALAMASGDVKAIDLMKDVPDAKLVEARQVAVIGDLALRNNPVLNEIENAPVEAKLEQVAIKDFQASKRGVLENKVAQEENNPPASILKSSPKVENKLDKLDPVGQSKDFDFRKTDNNPGKSLVEKQELVSSGESLDAKKFLLKEQTKTPHKVSTSHGSEGLIAASATLNRPVLVGADTLGEPGDRRLEPQAVGVVAEKIDALRAQGGGTLRVELAPEELGAIEIRVTQRASGLVVVKLSAEKSSTREALGASQSDILAQIEKTGISGRIEVSTHQKSLVTPEAASSHVAGFSSSNVRESGLASHPLNQSAAAGLGSHKDPFLGGMSSQEFRNIFESGFKIESRDTSSFDMSRHSSSAGAQREFSDSKGNPNPGNGREKAFDQWSSLFGQRKSA